MKQLTERSALALVSPSSAETSPLRETQLRCGTREMDLGAHRVRRQFAATPRSGRLGRRHADGDRVACSGPTVADVAHVGCHLIDVRRVGGAQPRRHGDRVRWRSSSTPTFVTPPFAEYVSGHSTFSRTAAEILTAFSGSTPMYDGTTRLGRDDDRNGQEDLLGRHVAAPGSLTTQAGPDTTSCVVGTRSTGTGGGIVISCSTGRADCGKSRMDSSVIAKGSSAPWRIRSR